MSSGSMGAVTNSSGMTVLICRSGYRFREVDTASKSTSSAASGVFCRTLAPPSVIRVTDRRFSTI